MKRFPHQLVVLNPTTTEDRYSNTIDDWDSPASFRECGDVQQMSATELIDGRTATVDDWRVFLSCDTKVTARSRIRWNGATYEVMGTPNRLAYGSNLDHTEARLKRVEG